MGAGTTGGFDKERDGTYNHRSRCFSVKLSKTYFIKAVKMAENSSINKCFWKFFKTYFEAVLSCEVAENSLATGQFLSGQQMKRQAACPAHLFFCNSSTCDEKFYRLCWYKYSYKYRYKYNYSGNKKPGTMSCQCTDTNTVTNIDKDTNTVGPAVVISAAAAAAVWAVTLFVWICIS